MALVPPNPPAQVTAAFSSGLPAFLSGPGELKKENYLGDIRPPVPSLKDVSSDGVLLVHDAQPVYVLGLGAPANRAITINVATGNPFEFVLEIGAAADQSIGPPAPAGWRLFAGDPKSKCVMGRVTQRPPANTWKLTAVHYGDRVQAVLQASDNLSKLPEVQNEDYELRVLDVPGLHLHAFWLVAKTAGLTDLVVPFPAAPPQRTPELNPAIPYAEFISRLAPLLQRGTSASPRVGS